MIFGKGYPVLYLMWPKLNTMKHLLTLTALLISSLAMAQVADYVPTDGLVAWYPFDGNGLDESANLLDINSDSNSPAVNRFGQGNAALRFENAPMISSHPQLNLTAKDTFTVSLWLQIDDFSQSFAVIGNNSGSGEENKGQLMYGWGPGSENFAWHVNSPGASGFGNFSNQVELEPDAWFHLVYIKSGNDFQFYKDGMLFGFGQYEYAQPYSDEPTWIGGGNDCCNLGLIGELDDLGIWDRELTEEEVTQLFNATTSSIWQEHYSSDFSDIDESWSTNESMTVVSDDYGSLLGAPFLAKDSVEFFLNDLTGDSLRLTYDLLLFGTWDGTAPPNSINGPDILGCALNDEVFFQATFSNIDTALGWEYSTNQSFPDSYVLGDSVSANPAGTGRKEYYPFYTTLDCQNCNVDSGQCGGGGLVVYELSFDFAINDQYATFKWFSDANASAWCDEFWAIDNVRVETLCTPGCADPLACNYDSQATCHEDCIFPVVGQDCQAGGSLCGEGTIWDSPTQRCLPEIECDSLYNPDVDFDGFIGLTDILSILSHYDNEWPPWQCGDPLEYQGYDYETVQIGEQCWFAENLRAENYSNGQSIFNGVESAEWWASEAYEGAYCLYGQGNSPCEFYGDEDVCVDSSGSTFLYNWYAVNNPSSLCPSGWSVPSDSGWMELETFLGMAEEELSAIGFRGGELGHVLKSSTLWLDPNTGEIQGEDFIGFNALPAGQRSNEGPFSLFGHDAQFWTSTPNPISNDGVYRSLHSNEQGIYRRDNFSPMGMGKSVRCTKDTE